MADTDGMYVTEDPINVVVEKSWTVGGSFTIQNRGGVPFIYVQQDDSSTPTGEEEHTHKCAPDAFTGHTVETDKGFWVWTEKGKTKITFTGS